MIFSKRGWMKFKSITKILWSSILITTVHSKQYWKNTNSTILKNPSRHVVELGEDHSTIYQTSFVELLAPLLARTPTPTLTLTGFTWPKICIYTSLISSSTKASVNHHLQIWLRRRKAYIKMSDIGLSILFLATNIWRLMPIATRYISSRLLMVAFRELDNISYFKIIYYLFTLLLLLFKSYTHT